MMLATEGDVVRENTLQPVDGQVRPNRTRRFPLDNNKDASMKAASHKDKVTILEASTSELRKKPCTQTQLRIPSKSNHFASAPT